MTAVNYRYKRSQNGEVIHRFGCGRAGNAVEWKWAEGKSEAQIREQLRPTQLMYRYCKVCFGNPDRDETERLLLRRQLEMEQG